jgi:hypothetical protein
MKYQNDLVILAMGTSRTLCPWDTLDINTVPVWSCNHGYVQIAEMGGYVSKVFMTHPQHQRKDGKGLAYNFDQMNMLVDHGVEILNINRCKGLKHKMFPLKRIIKKFDADYFSDTICYMLAYALDMWTVKKKGRLQLKEPNKKHRIQMYGVDMKTFDYFGSGEYQLEKGGIEFWLGRWFRGLEDSNRPSLRGEVLELG